MNRTIWRFTKALIRAIGCIPNRRKATSPEVTILGILGKTTVDICPHCNIGSTGSVSACKPRQAFAHRVELFQRTKLPQDVYTGRLRRSALDDGGLGLPADLANFWQNGF